MAETFGGLRFANPPLKADVTLDSQPFVQAHV
jgi:hypothetical protein